MAHFVDHRITDNLRKELDQHAERVQKLEGVVQRLEDDCAYLRDCNSNTSNRLHEAIKKLKEHEVALNKSASDRVEIVKGFKKVDEELVKLDKIIAMNHRQILRLS